MRRLAFIVAAIAFTCAGLEACSAKQGTLLLNGLPADAALVACVVEAAVATGGNVAGIAAACGSDAATVAEILWESATTPANAAAARVDGATRIRSTPAFNEVWLKKGMRHVSP